jgi:hypothetical protein
MNAINKATGLVTIQALILEIIEALHNLIKKPSISIT